MKEQMEETMFLGLRMMRGISKKDFETKYCVKIEEVYGSVLAKMYRNGLMEEKEERIQLTEKGIDISNYVLSHFLLD